MMIISSVRPRSNSNNQQQQRARVNSWSSCDDLPSEKKPRLASEELFEENRDLAQRQQDPDAETKRTTLLQEFDKLRQADMLTDVSFICSSSVVVRAHASFLYAVCPTLGKLLVDSGRNSSTGQIEIPLLQHSSQHVRKICDFLYNDDTIRVKTERELAQVKQCAGVMQVSLPVHALAVSEQQYVSKTTLVGHMGYVCALMLTDDGMLISGSRDNSIRVWDYKNSTQSKVELTDIHSDRVWALLMISNNGQQRLLSGSWDSTISVINPVTWKMEKRLVGHTDWVTCLCLVDKHFASGSADGTVRVWSIGENIQPERVLRGHRGHVYAMCASGDALFSAGNDGFVCAWDKQNWRRTARWDAHPQSNIRALVWSTRLNALLSGASDGKIRVWTNKTPGGYSIEHEVNAHADWVEALVEMNNSRVASGSRDCTVRIWKANSTRKFDLLQSIRQHSHWVYALVFTPENVLISASCDMKIKIWEEEKAAAEEEA